MPLSLFLVSHFLDTKLGSFCAKLDDKVSPLDNYVLHINRENLNLNVHFEETQLGSIDSIWNSFRSLFNRNADFAS